MSTKKTVRPASPPEATTTTAAALAPWNLLSDLGRQQFALATESACAMFRGSEAMRKVQQEAAHHSSEHHEAAAQKLRGPCAPAELLAIQSDLLRFDMQEAAQYWQQMADAALKAQLEMMGCASQMFNAGSVGDSSRREP
jgi:hypothetical protein